MLTAATGLIVEHHDKRGALQIIAPIRPHIRSFGLAFPRIMLLNEGFISMQDLASQEQFRQSIYQGLQTHPQLADPLRQRRACNRHPVAVADLLDTIQEQMIQILLDQDPGMQAGCGQATIDDPGRDRCGADGFAGPAGILRTNVTMDEETGRFDVQLLADVFTDLEQCMTTVTARAGFRLMTMLNAGQFRWQGIAAATFVRTWPGGRFLRFQLGDDGGTILITGLDKQVALLGRERLTLATETNASVVRQFEGKLRNLQLAPFEFGIAFGQLNLQRCDLRLKPLRQDRIGGFMGQFSDRIHGVYYTMQISMKAL